MLRIQEKQAEVDSAVRMMLGHECGARFRVWHSFCFVFIFRYMPRATLATQKLFHWFHTLQCTWHFAEHMRLQTLEAHYWWRNQGQRQLSRRHRVWKRCILANVFEVSYSYCRCVNVVIEFVFGTVFGFVSYLLASAWTHCWWECRGQLWRHRTLQSWKKCCSAGCRFPMYVSCCSVQVAIWLVLLTVTCRVCHHGFCCFTWRVT